MKRERRRFNVWCCGRRWGKNIGLRDLAAEVALNGGHVGWGTPVYRQLTDDFREMTNTLLPVIAKKSEQNREIRLITNGSIEFWSLDNPDAIRGRSYDLFVVNEGGLVGTLLDIFNFIIRPTLIDRRGSAVIAGTPKGRNGFWNLWQNGQDPEQKDWISWQFPTSVNPHVPPEEITAAQKALPERVFEQEMLAAFVEDAGGVFRRVMDAATAVLQEKGIPGHTYIMGVDLARKVDFTAIAVIDASFSPPQVVYIDRFNQIDWNLQTQRIKAVVERFRPAALYVDETGVGDPIVEQLRRELSQ